jgi:hypothetical protein
MVNPPSPGTTLSKMAEVDGSEEAWSIAGTTFAICVQQSTDGERESVL